MPSGRPRGPRRVEVPEGYLTVRDAAARLGLSVNGVRKLLYAGVLPSIAGPSQAKGIMRFVPVAAVESYVRPKRGRPPGTPNAQPRRKTLGPPSAPIQPNGQGPAQLTAPARPRLVPTAQTPATVWARLARLDGYRRELWADLQASPSAAVWEEWYLLLRRLLFAELAVLEELFAEPEVEVEGEKADRVNWFAENAEEEDEDA